MNSFTSSFEELNIPLHGVRLPEIHIEPKLKLEIGLKEDCSNYEFLRGLCVKGFNKLGLKKDSPSYAEYGKRIKYELETINELGFTDYILIVWDVMHFCQIKDIPVGRGRGSAAGSLVLFLINVTKIDPLKYGLYFERFISKTRAKKQIIDGITYLDGGLMMDVDNDICYYRRHEVLTYLNEKYKGKVSKILTFNTLSGKLLIKECGKIIEGKSEDEMTTVSGMIPKLFGKVEDLEDAYESTPDFKTWVDENPRIYKTALKLRDLIKNVSCHPSGILLSYQELEKSSPTELSSDGDIVSSYDMNWVSTLNVKLDILGLRGVSVVDSVCKSLGIRADDINVDDPSIYRSLFDMKYPHGLFQIEADLASKVVQKVKPKHFDDLGAVLALARPGSLAFIEEYSNFSNTGTLPSFDVESQKLKDILAKTGGVVLYQETLMVIAHEVFELSLDQAELIRRACGKKKKEEMEKFKQIIFDKGAELKIPKSAQFYWNALISSADYAFNKCGFAGDFVIEKTKGKITLKDVKIGDRIKSYNVTRGGNHFVEVLDSIWGSRYLYEVTVENGKKHTISMEHKLLCEDRLMRPLEEIISENLSIVVESASEYFVDIQKISTIKAVGELPTVDLEVDHSDHNFFCNGFVTSNSHSYAYASLSAMTVYLKFNHPKEFFLSLLKMSKHEPDPINEISIIQREMSHFNLKLLPPHLQKSEMDFSIEDEGIRFGLSCIKGVAEKTIDKLLKFKSKNLSKLEMFTAAREVGLPIGILSALIQAGALEDYKNSRVKTVYEAQLWNILTNKEKPRILEYAPTFSHDLVKTLRHVITLKNEKGKPLIKESRVETIRKNSKRFKTIFEQNILCESFANWWYETMLLGYAASCRLIDIFRCKIEGLMEIGLISDQPAKARINFIGRITEEVKKGTSKKGSPYLSIVVSDDTGSMKVMIFNDKLSECESLNTRLPKEGDVVIVKGTKMDGTVFADLIAIQQNKIHTGLASVKELEDENSI